MAYHGSMSMTLFYIYQILPPQSAEPMRKLLVDVSTSSRLTDDYEAGLS